MLVKVFCVFAVSWGLFLGLPEWGSAATPSPAAKGAPEAVSTPQPEKILRNMADFLKSQGQFGFRAEVTEDRAHPGGKKLQYGMDLEVLVRRPDKLRVNSRGDLDQKELLYDGKTLTLYQRSQNTYATAPRPPTLDEALAKSYQDFGLRLVLTDLVSSNAYGLMTQGIKHALYAGLHRVGGVPCHHLAFVQDGLQWQIWIEAGAKPLPRKILINHQSRQAASPQWTAYLRDWNLTAQLSDNLFIFTPPAGAKKIDFLPASKAAPPKAAPPKKTKGEKM